MAKQGLSKRMKPTIVMLLAFSMIFTLLSPIDTSATDRKFNMSYVYFGDSSSYASLVDKTGNSLNEVSPSYFNISSDGTLQLTPAVDGYFVEQMHSRGIKVIPFLSNHWDRELGRRALANRDVLAQQIADTIAQYNIDGVNVDIENMTELDRSDYTDLVRLLREKLPPERSVSVAVAPNPYNWVVGWQGSYDYEALSQYSDYLMLMTYDEHYQGGDPGPVASSGFVEKSIEYALEKVPPEKLVLGIPFYGRYWKNGSSYGGYGINVSTVESMVKKYNGKVTYDYTTQSPKAVITIKSTDTKPYVFGSRLSAGTYTIWYENSQSTKYKLKLVQKYGLKGTGSWSLGQESTNTWKYYDLWLNGVYFTDVEGHWARNSILAATLKGWVKGVSDTSYQPEAALTRAQAATMLVRALGLEGETATDSFPDTIDHWARDEISIAKQHNIIMGDTSGYFFPDAPVTREQMAVMLDRIFTGLVTSDYDSGIAYNDVNSTSSSWSYDSIMKMTYAGVFNGFPDGGFHPGDNITRAQMAVLLDKISKYIEVPKG